MDYAHPEMLVDVDWVEENCLKKGVRLIEVNYNPEKAYFKGHIRGATLIRWEDMIKEESYVDKAFGQAWVAGMDAYDDGLPRDILDRREFEKLMSKHGIERDTKVILYGDHGNWFAAYAFWLFKIYNHQDICLMNGGRTKWELDGREYVLEETQVQPTKYKVKSDSEGDFRASLDDVYDSLDTKDMRLVDIRSPEEYSGETTSSKDLGLEEMDKKGHIPGAVNVPASETVNKDGTFKGHDELLELYKSHGVISDESIVTYCRLGERAAHSWVILRYLLGYPNVASYDGSWEEWGTARGVPIKTSCKPDGTYVNKERKSEKKSKGWGGGFWGRK